MDRVYFTKLGKKYTVSPCNMDSIDSHYELVRANVTDVPEVVYKERMRVCIESGLTYQCSVDGINVAIMYIDVVQRHGEGVYIHGTDPIAFMLLFKLVSDESHIHKILVKPHSDTYKYYKSLFTKPSARDYLQTGSAPAIRISDAIDKFKPILDKEIVWEMQ